MPTPVLGTTQRGLKEEQLSISAPKRLTACWGGRHINPVIRPFDDCSDKEMLRCGARLEDGPSPCLWPPGEQAGILKLNLKEGVGVKQTKGMKKHFQEREQPQKKNQQDMSRTTAI